MDSIPGFFLCVGLLLALTILTFAAFHRPMQAILTEVCGAEHRARFWVRFFAASMILAMLFCSLWALPAMDEGTMGLTEVARILRAGIFGMLGSLGFLAMVMLAWQSRFERGLAPPAPRIGGAEDAHRP